MDLSFVIPVKNEEESIEKLAAEIITEVNKLRLSYEIIFVDDGSTDETFNNLKKIKNSNKSIKTIKLRGNWGKSTALSVGFKKATGSIIFTLDGDLQDNPVEIPKFLEKIQEEKYDLVSGWKKTRHDPSITKVIPSRIINYLTRKITGTPIHDINCGFKAYRKEVVDSLNLYGELYRFIPVIAHKQNFKVGEIVVRHRARKYGSSKFGWERGVKGFLDLITIIFLTGYLRRPGHFFGGLGLLSFGSGFVIGLYITYLRISTGTIQDRHPLLFFGMLLMIIGVQLISTGLMAEMITYWRQRDSKEDPIEKSY